MGLTRQLAKRLTDLERVVGHLPRANQFDVVEAVPTANARGREPGLYRAGPPGSTAGMLVYDPAQGAPVLPEGALTPWGLFLVCEPGSFQPGVDYAD